MNPVKKILVNFKKTRSVYDPHNISTKRKYNPSTAKEQMRLERRMKKINRYDDEVTHEPPIDALTNAKANSMLKMFNEYHNCHRLSRTPMPKAEKEEYIKKCKEFSLYRNYIWRHQRNEMVKSLKNEDEMMKTVALLPVRLMQEVLDLENYYENEGQEEEGNIQDDYEYRSNQKAKRDSEEFEDYDEERRMKGLEYLEEKEEEWKENNENVESLEFHHDFLYLPQLLKVYPDDYHIIHKTLINLSAYETAKQAGTEMGDANMGGDEDKD